MGLIDRLRSMWGSRLVIRDKGPRSSFHYRNETLADNETIFSAISMLSGAMASLPVTLRQDANRILPGDHPVAKLLEEGPNHRMTAFEFMRCLEVNRDVSGAGYAVIELNDRGQIAGLWAVKSNCITPMVERETKELYYQFKDEDGNELAYLYHSLVVAVRHISTDGVHPISPIDVLQSSLAYDKEVKQFSVEQMQNGLRASMAIKWPESNLSKEQIEEYNGVLRTFMKSGVLYLDRGKEAQELRGSDIIDPKVFEVEHITIARVARVYNIPLEKFLPEKTSFSSAEQSDLNYLRDTILPMVRMYEQELTQKLLTEQERAGGMYIKFQLNGFARSDMKTRGEFYQRGIRNGWFCPDDIRALEDMPPIPDGGGRDFYLSKDLIPIRALGEQYAKTESKEEQHA